MKIINNRIFLSFFMIFITIILGDALYINSAGSNIYPMYYSLFFSLYLFGYFWIILFSEDQPTFKQIMIFFLVIKIYIFITLFFSESLAVYRLELGVGGDPYRYHIPQGLSMKYIDALIEYLFSKTNPLSGRLTHVLISLNCRLTEILGLYKFEKLGYLEVGKIMFLFNLIPNLLTLYFVYKAAYIYSNSLIFANRSMFFLALNPFFLQAASSAKKEAILMLALSIFLVFIVSKKKDYKLFIISLVIVLFERIYMIPFFLAIYFYLNSSLKSVMLITVLTLLFLDAFIGIEVIYNRYQDYLNNFDANNSYLDNGIVSNFLRALFAPAFIRPFTYEYFNGQFIGFVSAILYVFFSYVAIKSFFYLKGVLSIVFLTYLYIFLLIPTHSTFKIMVLSVFVAIFLDKVSFVKLKYKS